VQCLSEICSKFVELGEQRLLTASLGVRYEDKVCVYSFAGCAHLLERLLQWSGVKIPRQLEELADWCDQVQSTLREISPSARFSSAAEEMFTSGGSFFLPRHFVDWRPQMEPSGLSLAVQVQDAAIASALASGELQAVQAALVNACTCSRCGTSYFDCPCSALMDRSIGVELESFSLLGFFVTTRSAQPNVETTRGDDTEEVDTSRQTRD
jgi:hypothetical protein